LKRKVYSLSALLLFFLVVLNSSLVMGYNDKVCNFGIKEKQHSFTNFVNFTQSYDNEKISSANSGSQLIFIGGIIPNILMNEQTAWASPEEYFFDIEHYVGNCTSFSFKVNVQYNFQNTSAFNSFTIILGSYFNARGENSTTHVLKLRLGKFFVEMETKGGGIPTIKSYKLPLKQYAGNLTFQITKFGKRLKCSIFNSLDNSFSTKSWKFYNLFVPLHFLSVRFYSNSNQNSLVLSNVEGTLLSEDYDWLAARNLARTYFILEVIGISLFILLVFSFVAGRNIRRDLQEKRAKQEGKIAFNKYLERMKEALERAKERKRQLSPEELLSLVPESFEGHLVGEICMVCKLPFKSDEKNILQCPLCGSLYHQEHLLEWLTAKKTCPVCKEPLLAGDD